MDGPNREALSMEINQSEASALFNNKKNGCCMNKAVTNLLATLLVSAVVAMGLLAYYHASQVRETQINLYPTYSELKATPPAAVHSVTTEPNVPEKKQRPYVRLPRSIKPIHYKVKLQPFINGNFSIHGHVEIEMEVLSPTTNISLHINDIVTKNDTIKLRPADTLNGSGMTIIRHSYDEIRQFYIAHLTEALEEGKRYVLSMDFEGYLNDKLNGFYRSSYTDNNGNKVLLAITHFQPTDTRKAFPCFDEPGLKASFDISLARQANMTSISNMPRYKTTPIEDQPGWFWDHFKTSVPMSTYLVAFLISDFVHLNSSYNDHVLFRVWARENAIGQADYALRSGPSILTFFEEYFNVSFPLPKSDMVAVPDFGAGAMENWGLVIYRETAMLYDPLVSSASNKQRILLVVAHELAHQWFGNLVTPEWWTDIWLNEGFASYMEYVGADHFEPTWNMMQQMVINKLQSVLSLDCLESSHPISVPVYHPDEIFEIFDGISYDKGASIIRMMNYFLTTNTFRKGVSNYLRELKYKNAEQDDLWDYLTRAGHEDGTLPSDVTVKTVMDTWTLQMGYPVIKVERSDCGTSATVSQERFLLVKNENSTDTHDYKWWVPLTYTCQDNPRFEDTKAMVWMQNDQPRITIESMPSKDKWVIFNLQETGYYRVNYDENNWNLIVKQLKDNHEIIDVMNRAQILDDALDLARAGQLSYSTALRVMSYLSKEREYVPWTSALNNLGYLKNMLSRSSVYGALKKYLLDMVIPLYNSVGFKDKNEDPLLDQYKRVKALSWACNLGYTPCINSSLTLFRRWMASPNDLSIISPNLKNVVYCTAIAEGGEEEWDFAWAQYLSSNVASERANLLSALGCSKQIWILSRYIQLAFKAGSGVRKQDAVRVFGSVAYNNIGRYLAWNYLRDNWKTITEYYSSSTFGVGYIIKSTTNSFNTEFELKELKKFRDENKDTLKAATRAAAQTIESTSNNIAWMKKNYDVITKWLESHGYYHKLKNQ